MTESREKRTTPRSKRDKGKNRLRDIIIEEIRRYPDAHAQTGQILEKVRLQYPTIHRRTVQRRIRELVSDGTLEEKDNHVYHAPYETRLFASLFGGQAFLNLLQQSAPAIWEHQRQQQERQQKMKEQGLPIQKIPGPNPKDVVELVKIFGVYMIFCFLEASRPTDKIKSYEDRMNLLRSMVPLIIDLRYGMYYKFIEIVRGKPFEALSGFENKDKDTLELDKETIRRWKRTLRKQYPSLVEPLESSAGTARNIVK